MDVVEFFNNSTLEFSEEETVLKTSVQGLNISLRWSDLADTFELPVTGTLEEVPAYDDPTLEIMYNVIRNMQKTLQALKSSTQITADENILMRGLFVDSHLGRALGTSSISIAIWWGYAILFSTSLLGANLLSTCALGIGGGGESTYTRLAKVVRTDLDFTCREFFPSIRVEWLELT